MKKHNSDEQESDDQFIKDINHTEGIGFGEGAAICQVCGSSLVEGEPVSVYAFRPVSQADFQFGCVLCAEHRDEFVAEWTLGVREVVAWGRVGVVRDVAMQSSWLVLLAAEPVVVSPVDSSDAVRVEEIDADAASGAEAETCSNDDDAESDDVMGVDELREPRTAGRPVGGLGSCVAGDAESGDVHDAWSDGGVGGGGGDA